MNVFKDLSLLACGPGEAGVRPAPLGTIVHAPSWKVQHDAPKDWT